MLVYDEPPSGLDPLTTDYVLKFVRELADRGKTVLFSAHNLYHVESVCDRVPVMNEGEPVARGAMDAIRAEYGETTYRVFTTVPVDGATPVGNPRPTAVAPDGSVPTADASDGTVAGASDGTSVGASGDHGTATTDEGDDRYRIDVDSMTAVERVREACETAGGRVADIRTQESTLEEIFLDVAGQPMPGSRRVGDESFTASRATGATKNRSAADGASEGDDTTDANSGRSSTRRRSCWRSSSSCSSPRSPRFWSSDRCRCTIRAVRT